MKTLTEINVLILLSAFTLLLAIKKRVSIKILRNSSPKKSSGGRIILQKPSQSVYSKESRPIADLSADK